MIATSPKVLLCLTVLALAAVTPAAARDTATLGGQRTAVRMPAFNLAACDGPLGFCGAVVQVDAATSPVVQQSAVALAPGLEASASGSREPVADPMPTQTP